MNAYMGMHNYCIYYDLLLLAERKLVKLFVLQEARVRHRLSETCWWACREDVIAECGQVGSGCIICFENAAELYVYKVNNVL